MHVISDGTILTLAISLGMNACFILYLAASYTDKEESR